MSRPVYEYRSVSRVAFQKFRKDHPNVQIEFKDWKKVVYTFNQLFRDYILESAEKAKMPYGLGELVVRKYKPRTYSIINGEQKINLPIDWAKTRKAGKKIYHLNAHTDGYKFHVKWMKSNCRIRKKEIWSFKPTRDFSRLIKQYLKKPGHEYKELYKEW